MEYTRQYRELPDKTKQKISASMKGRTKSYDHKQHIKQAKATRNKHLGITMDCYDKAVEIENASGMKYISDFYGHRKRLHRLEMRMNCEQIKRACKKTKTRYQLDLITQQESLDAIFIYALQSVLMFRRGRKVLQWEDLFKCGVR